MRACPSCDKRIPDQVAVCAFCGAEQATPPPRKVEADTVPAPVEPQDAFAETQLSMPRRTIPGAPGVGAPGRPAPRPMLPSQSTPGLVVMGEAAGGGTRWVRAVLIAAALSVAGGIAAMSLRPTPFPSEALSAVGAEEAVICRARPVCVVVYLAPWSEASKTSLPLVERLRDRWRDDEEIGLAIVVGHDSPERVERYAEALGSNTWADTDDEVFRRLKLDVAPSWFTLDATGRVEHRLEGTFFPLDLQLLKLGVEGG